MGAGGAGGGAPGRCETAAAGKDEAVTRRHVVASPVGLAIGFNGSRMAGARLAYGRIGCRDEWVRLADRLIPLNDLSP